MAEEGKKYVLHGMYAECSMGTMKNYLNTDVGHGVVYQGQPLLNANDHTPQINLTHFGDCNSKMIYEEAKKQADEKYKAEAGDNFFERAGKALAKNVTKAVVTVQECFAVNKCQLDTPLPWRFCNEEHMVDGAPALTMDSVCPCKFGGIISIVEVPDPEPEEETGEETGALEQTAVGGIGAAVAGLTAGMVSEETMTVSMEPALAEIVVQTGTVKKVPDNKKEVQKSRKIAKPNKRRSKLFNRVYDTSKADGISDTFDFPQEYIDKFLKAYETHKIENGRYVLDNGGQTIALGHDVVDGEDFSQGLSLKEGELLAIEDLNKKYRRVKEKIEQLNSGEFGDYKIDINNFTKQEMLFLIDFEFNRGDGLIDHKKIREEKEKQQKEQGISQEDQEPDKYEKLNTSIAILIAAVADEDYEKVDEVLMMEVCNTKGEYLSGLERRRMDEYELLMFDDYERDDDIGRDYKLPKEAE